MYREIENKRKRGKEAHSIENTFQREYILVYREEESKREGCTSSQRERERESIPLVKG